MKDRGFGMNKLVFSLSLLLLFFSGPVWAADLQITSVDYNPAPAVPGSYFTLYAHVYNNSLFDAKDVVFQLKLFAENYDTPYPFSLEPSDSGLRALGTIKAYQSAVVQFKVQADPNALDGVYSITLEVGETGKTGGFISKFPIHVLKRKPQISIVGMTPTQAFVGKTVLLELTLENIGLSPAENISIGIDEERTVTTSGAVVERSIVPLGAARVSTPSLPPGESVTLSLPVLVNPSAIPKAYFIPVTLEFYDENKTKYTETPFIGLQVLNEPSLGALVSSAEPLPSPGSKTELTLDVYNNGTGSARYLIVRVESAALEFSQSEYFIGSLEADDFDSIALNARVKGGTALGAHAIEVEFEFKDEYGERFSVKKSVPFTVYSTQEAAKQNGSETPWVLYLVAVVLIAGAWFAWTRRRKAKNV